MREVGIVGLDTSHPAAFAEILDDRDDVTIGGVWDDGTVRDDEHVDQFCADTDAERFEDVETMAESVDGAMVLTVDWETHVPLATAFLDADVPTLVDKPLAADLASLDRLEASAEEAPLCGGSAVPFHPELRALPCGGEDRTIFAAGYNDFYYYRVHLSDTLRRLADAPWAAVEPTDDPGTTLRVVFENGVHSWIRYDGTPDEGVFGVLDVTDSSTTAVEIRSGEDSFAALYEPYIESFVHAIYGDRDDTALLIDAAQLGLAVEAALDAGRRVTPDDDVLTETKKDSSTFVGSYEPYY
ncbi:Gfo/Idh/MocA family oxidoreductase [Haloarchaeobius sp. DFWS5]|uniref:Gfo/Idh/MocA family oxidoreductase n=1 Tax=Haloarchaeobius sp. DFWS5 TaxID=3446114 RepID=UPI003EB9F00D